MENNKKENNRLFIIFAIISVFIGLSSGNNFSQILLTSFISFAGMVAVAIAVG
jgi:hypothetical protein